MKKIKIGGNFIKEQKLINILLEKENIEIININSFYLIQNINDLDAIIYYETNLNKELQEFYNYFNINYIRVFEINNHLFFSLNNKYTFNNIDECLLKVTPKQNNNIFYILSSLNDVIEIKEHTIGHAIRTSYLAKEFSQFLDLDKKKIEDIYIGGLLHDIGKIITPDSVLFKSGKLTKEEFNVIKEHTKIIDNLLPDEKYNEIKQIILHHHEKIDGTGYPDKLKLNEITYQTKLVSIIDSYDAMTSSRSYKPAITPLLALKELELCSQSTKNNGKGLYYDQILVNKFIEFIKEYVKGE